MTERRAQCFLFDLDGTLADLSHRLHFIQQTPKDWDAFYAACVDDASIPHMTKLARLLRREHCIVIVTGRSDQVRNETENWLALNGLRGSTIYMRKVGDHRPDNIIKSELLDQIIADGFDPIMAFEDRDQVVAMWRERGIPCAQVALGDF